MEFFPLMLAAVSHPFALNMMPERVNRRCDTSLIVSKAPLFLTESSLYGLLHSSIHNLIVLLFSALTSLQKHQHQRL